MHLGCPYNNAFCLIHEVENIALTLLFEKKSFDTKQASWGNFKKSCWSFMLGNGLGVGATKIFIPFDFRNTSLLKHYLSHKSIFYTSVGQFFLKS
jgi:hypothetical protein